MRALHPEDAEMVIGASTSIEQFVFARLRKKGLTDEATLELIRQAFTECREVFEPYLEEEPSQ